MLRLLAWNFFELFSSMNTSSKQSKNCNWFSNKICVWITLVKIKYFYLPGSRGVANICGWNNECESGSAVHCSSSKVNECGREHFVGKYIRSVFKTDPRINIYACLDDDWTERKDKSTNSLVGLLYVYFVFCELNLEHKCMHGVFLIDIKGIDPHESQNILL